MSISRTPSGRCPRCGRDVRKVGHRPACSSPTSNARQPPTSETGSRSTASEPDAPRPPREERLLTFDVSHTLGQRPEQIQAFGCGYIPQTIAIAELLKDAIAPLLPSDNCHWPYPDRVLAMLLPNLLPDIERFHNSTGRDMSGFFKEHQLSRIDTSLVKKLANLLERSRPGND